MQPNLQNQIEKKKFRLKKEKNLIKKKNVIHYSQKILSPVMKGNIFTEKNNNLNFSLFLTIVWNQKTEDIKIYKLLL